MSQTIPTLDWKRHDTGELTAALPIAGVSCLHIFSTHRAGYELWYRGSIDEHLGWFATEDEAQAAGRTWVGDDADA